MTDKNKIKSGDIKLIRGEESESESEERKKVTDEKCQNQGNVVDKRRKQRRRCGDNSSLIFSIVRVSSSLLPSPLANSFHTSAAKLDCS